VNCINYAYFTDTFWWRNIYHINHNKLHLKGKTKFYYIYLAQNLLKTRLSTRFWVCSWTCLWQLADKFVDFFCKNLQSCHGPARICLHVKTDLTGLQQIHRFFCRKQVSSKIYATKFKNDKRADFFEQMVDRKTSNGLILSWSTNRLLKQRFHYTSS